MPLDGSGSWVPAGSTVNPAVTNTAISSTDWNTLLADLKTSLSTAMFKDGQATPTANIPMGGFKLTGLAAGSVAGNSLRYEQVFSSSGGVILAPRGYLSGLTLSTAGASSTMSIAAGQASDSTNAQMMTLAAALGKTTASWAVGTGQGGVDTGAIANSTWYHFYLIQRTDTGVVDVLFSTNATTPTLPTNYTLYRRIGCGKTTAGGLWTSFVQDGDLFQWLVPTNNVNTTNPGTAAVLSQTDTPTGVKTIAYISALYNYGSSTANTLYLSDPAVTDSAADATSFFSLIGATAGANNSTAGEFFIRTNTTPQVRWRLSASGASDVVRIATKGWRDRRGQDA